MITHKAELSNLSECSLNFRMSGKAAFCLPARMVTSFSFPIWADSEHNVGWRMNMKLPRHDLLTSLRDQRILRHVRFGVALALVLVKQSMLGWYGISMKDKLTIIISFQILIKYGIFLYDMLGCRWTDRRAMSVEKLRLEVTFPKLFLWELSRHISTEFAGQNLWELVLY